MPYLSHYRVHIGEVLDMGEVVADHAVQGEFWDGTRRPTTEAVGPACIVHHHIDRDRAPTLDRRARFGLAPRPSAQPGFAGSPALLLHAHPSAYLGYELDLAAEL